MAPVVAAARKLRRSWAHGPRCAGLAIVGLALTAVVTPTLRAGQPSETSLKAAFVVSFLKFVEWPPVPPGTPLVLVLVGDAPIASALKDSTAGLQVGGRPVHVRVADGTAALGDAHAVFIAATEHEQVPAILRALDRRSVLTIGDTDGFAASGVVLNLVMQDHRVRVEANTAAAARAGLKVSAHLLRLARIVG
jgi:hypothetical protein